MPHPAVGSGRDCCHIGCGQAVVQLFTRRCSLQYDHIVARTLDDPDETDGGGYRGALPTEADFLMAYATVPGYVSWRNSE